MAYANNNLLGSSRPGKVEYIELGEFDTPGAIKQQANNERRLSNRTWLKTLEVNQVIRRDFLKFWKQIKSVRCELINISFTGIGIRSKELIRIGDTIDLSLSCETAPIKQVLPVRICNHYRGNDGYYAYGGTLEHLLNADFRRLIVCQLTRLDH